MSTLHLVRSSPFANQELAQCLNTLTANDHIVLLDDGCYALNHSLIHTFIKKPTDITIHVIDSHLEARALTSLGSVQVINMSKLVELTLTHNTVITWQ